MEWVPGTMATGVELVDKQHQEIIRRVNNVVEKLDDCGEAFEDIELLIDFLADYVVVHFQSEEGLQKEVDYPGYEEHKFEHEGFLDRFIKLRNGYNQLGFTPLNIQSLLDMTSLWLFEHIAGSDACFAVYYRNNKH